MQCFTTIECKQEDIATIVDIVTSLQHNNAYTNQPISIFLLLGEVGSGKTYFVGEYAKRLNIQAVSSPSFAFIHEYEHTLYHYDLYLKNDSESKLKLLESIQKKGIHFIEWGNEKLMQTIYNMGFSCILIKILPSTSTYSRIYKFFAPFHLIK